VQAAIRQIAFLDREIAEVEKLIATEMLSSPEARRLMTVPGVNLIATATFLAAIGEISRFSNSRRLVAYLGLDPRVRQSGEQPARSGRISKRGSAQARWALVEATWSVVNQPSRCGRSTCGSAPAAGMAKRSSRPPANSQPCSGACSPVGRTTPTSSRR
jgi:transposase